MLRFVNEVRFANESQIDFISEPLTERGFIKVFIQGKLAAEGHDQRLLLRINDEKSSYRSFVHMGGDAGAGEWGDDSGIYLGRNGWNLDATFSAEFTIAVNTENQQVITGSGASVFALGNDTILGYESHGRLVSNDPVSKISFLFTGGQMTGYGKHYIYE
ncbi:hypothetical protein CN980_29170 [Bacillus cereus]|uniref:Uncharacterized protein n=1 Tax=Bacillus cereus TaxID=1396 RepID=A0A9X7C6G1_BACCE|nr:MULTISPECIES: hypothetical protein [Bacillus cereus group]PGO61803.1 hypothetical protein CN980_29170 [Bacillus cereus]PRT13204.1 hypothetical protein C6352_02325 [Bacillus thuringiensis]